MIANPPLAKKASFYPLPHFGSTAVNKFLSELGDVVDKLAVAVAYATEHHALPMGGSR